MPRQVRHFKVCQTSDSSRVHLHIASSRTTYVVFSCTKRLLASRHNSKKFSMVVKLYIVTILLSSRSIASGSTATYVIQMLVRVAQQIALVWVNHLEWSKLDYCARDGCHRGTIDGKQTVRVLTLTTVKVHILTVTTTSADHLNGSHFERRLIACRNIPLHRTVLHAITVLPQTSSSR